MGKGFDGVLWHIGAVVWFLFDFIVTNVVLVQSHAILVIFFGTVYMVVLALQTNSHGTIIPFYRFRTVQEMFGAFVYTVTPIGLAALYLLLSLFSILFKRVGKSANKHNAQTHALLYISDNTSIALPVTTEYGLNQ